MGIARRRLAGDWTVPLCRRRGEVATSELREGFMCPINTTMTGQLCKDPVHAAELFLHHGSNHRVRVLDDELVDNLTTR
jgi:hypothetical protein